MQIKARAKEVTGLLHVSDRLLAVELSRVEAARGTLQPLSDIYETKSLIGDNGEIGKCSKCCTISFDEVKLYIR